jgi:Transcriptional regulator PadR-like family
MKRDDMNIDDILKRYLPHASQEDVDTAGDTVLKRIREMRFQAEPAAEPAPAKAVTDGDWLHDFHVGLLMAVEGLQGYGDPVRITLKMQDVLEEKVVWGTAVYLNLLLMERMGLVSSSPDPEKPEEMDRRQFAITQAGRETLAKALAFRQEAEVRARRPRFA